jgi:hypothetical protein
MMITSDGRIEFHDQQSFDIAERVSKRSGNGEAPQSPAGWLPRVPRDGLANGLIAVLVAYATVRSVFAAAWKPLWYDELCTAIVAKLPSVSTIWRALTQAIDGNPPLYYLVERAASRLMSNREIAFRIPSVGGLCMVLVCVFLFVKKRGGPATALGCSVLTLFTILYTTYAAEARPYSLAVACVAVALVCFQRAPSKPWMLLMGFTLALSVALHYYAVFALVPFVLAETSLVLNARRLRAAVWLALVGGFVPFIVFWPLLARLKEVYAAHFWASATVADVFWCYGAMLGIPARVGVAVFGVLVFGLVVTLPELLSVREGRAEEFSEYVLILGFLCLPLILFAAMRITHGAMLPRYALPTILGVPLAMGFVLRSLDRRAVSLVAILVVMALGAQEASFWQSRGRLSNEGYAPSYVRTFIDSVGYKDLPVVASDGHEYLQIEYYSSPEWNQRFFAVVDPSQALAYSGTDTVDKQLLVLSRFEPLHVFDFRYFSARHPKFLLYSPGEGRFDWLPALLCREGYLIQILNVEGDHKVYLVSAKND